MTSDPAVEVETGTQSDIYDIGTSLTIKQEIKSKEYELENKKKSESRCRTIKSISIAVTFIVFSISIFMFSLSFQSEGVSVLFRLSYLVGIFYFTPLLFVGVVWYRARVILLSEQVAELEFELEILRYPISEQEIRAEKLFRRNEYDLARYYSLNLKQNQWILIVGLACIGAGLLIVSTTLAIVFGVLDQQAGAASSQVSQFDVYVKGIVAAVGAVGAIMVNVVAAIYLQMHSRASQALGEFHKRLVETNQLFLSNVLAARVSDKAEREKLLGDMAKLIVGYKTS